MIEHCVSSFKNKVEIESYRSYMADCGYVLSNSVHRLRGGQEDIIAHRYSEIIHPKEEKEETADEIKNRIRDKLEGRRNGPV